MSHSQKRRPVPQSELVARLRHAAAEPAEPSPEPGPAAASPPFVPTHVSSRFDGWTADRQIAFIDALADTGSVDQAAAHVGMTRASAYNLRRNPHAEAFARAWWHATRLNLPQLCDSLLDQCIHGIVTDRYYKGEYIGERRTFIPAIAFNLLKRLEDQSLNYWIAEKAPGCETHEQAVVTCTRELAARMDDSNYITDQRR